MVLIGARIPPAMIGFTLGTDIAVEVVSHVRSAIYASPLPPLDTFKSFPHR